MPRRIGVLCSGGDAPGMNASVRAVVRAGSALGWDVLGVRRGYAGLLDGDVEHMGSRGVGSILRQGGTVLMTARSEEFKTPRGQQQAVRMMTELGMNGLVVLGGDGSTRGAIALRDRGIPVVVVPVTIDNDVVATEMCIGVDTALNTIIDAVDKIKDTAASLRRAFVVEVMGRRCGYLALMAAIASGAEMVIVPEVPLEPQRILQELDEARARGKPHFIVIVAEGAHPTAQQVSEIISEAAEGEEFQTRVTVLGHVQRGGTPTAFDRLLASRMGAEAVRLLAEGQDGRMVILKHGRITSCPLDEALEARTPDWTDLYALADVLAQ
ncbi:MAG: 6-phosphofructokinase [Armatimonadota bacterium]